jgi:hypothetical protein
LCTSASGIPRFKPRRSVPSRPVHRRQAPRGLVRCPPLIDAASDCRTICACASRSSRRTPKTVSPNTRRRPAGRERSPGYWKSQAGRAWDTRSRLQYGGEAPALIAAHLVGSCPELAEYFSIFSGPPLSGNLPRRFVSRESGWRATEPRPGWSPGGGCYHGSLRLRSALLKRPAFAVQRLASAARPSAYL